MDAQTIINEMKERGENMALCIGSKFLVWADSSQWVVYREVMTQGRTLYAGADFWQAFAALCGATQQARSADVLPCGHSLGIVYGEKSWYCAVCGETVRG